MGIGQIQQPVGVRGDVYVEVFSHEPQRYSGRTQIFVHGVPYVVEFLRPRGRSLVLKLKGIDTPEAAAELRGAIVQVHEDDLTPPPVDAYYQFQIVGLKVVTTDGRDLGEVVEIVETPANDVYVARGPAGEVMIPAIADVVKSIDLERQILTVEAIPGLL